MIELNKEEIQELAAMSYVFSEYYNVLIKGDTPANKLETIFNARDKLLNACNEIEKDQQDNVAATTELS